MLKHKRNFLFDIDGTLAVDTTLYKGTKELLKYIDSIGGHTFYITNNSTKSRKDYVQKFKCWEIETTKEQFITASYATCLYLKEHYGTQRLFVVGTPSFVTELKEFGLNITQEIEAEVVGVVVGFDQTLTYEKIEKACQLLFQKEIDYIGTNPDKRCPTKFGFVPDCGGICDMIEAAVERTPLYIGKPNPDIVNLCLQESGTSKEETIVVGDRLYTDIACGILAGVDTAVVLTGEAKRVDLTDTNHQPTYCFETIDEFYKAVKGLL